MNSLQFGEFSSDLIFLLAKHDLEVSEAIKFLDEQKDCSYSNYYLWNYIPKEYFKFNRDRYFVRIKSSINLIKDFKFPIDVFLNNPERKFSVLRV